MPGARFSDDGLWWWDGQAWQPALSPDGRWRWDGSQWLPFLPASARQPAAAVQSVGRAPRSWLTLPITRIGLAAAILALVAGTALIVSRQLSPKPVSGSGYRFVVPQDWRPSRPGESCRIAAPFRVTGNGKEVVDIANRPILRDTNWAPDAVICASDQSAGQDARIFQGTEPYYAIFVFVGITLDDVNFKPPPPWATPGYDARIPISFPGSTRSEEIECTQDVSDVFPLWCWHVPGGQRSDSVDRDPPLCGPGKRDPAPVNNGEYFPQIARFVSASHGSRNYLIVLSGYRVPIAGFPEQYCRDFYQVLQSWKWTS